MSASDIVCGNPECRVAQDGKCVEGHQLNECPYYGKPPGEALQFVEVQTKTANQNIEIVVDLDSAKSLDTDRASFVLARRASRVIAIVGPHESGKTSLIAGLYELFQLGPVFDINFAGSRTLHAFELICHDARAASLRDVPHTERTKRGEVRFYHLDLYLPGAAGLISLLMGDRAGEEYAAVADEVAAAEPLYELRRATTVTLLIDGTRLCNQVTRHALRGEIGGILQGLIEAGIFNHRPQLAIVLTKFDEVVKAKTAETASGDFDRLVTGICERHGAVFSQIKSFKTAASPKDTDTARGLGLKELVDFWSNSRESQLISVEQAPSDRVFDLLKAR